jgi:hypothetical protein
MLNKKDYLNTLVKKGLVTKLSPCKSAHITRVLCSTVGNKGFGRLIATEHLTNGLVQLYLKA